MIIHKCDRCGCECRPHTIGDYDFCDMCYQGFVDFINMRDCSPEGVFHQLVEYGQHDNRFHLGETIKYSPSEVMEILKGEI